MVRSHFRLHADASKVSKWREVFLKETAKIHPKNTKIIKQGENTICLYYIIKGIVEYTHTDEDGVENFIEVIGPGSIIGMQPFFQKAVATGSFTALTEVEAVSLYKDEVYSNINRDSAFATEIIEELCKMVNGLVTQLFTHSKSADDKIKEIICALCETDRAHKSEPIFIGLSQSELARITRTTRATVAKVIGDLKKEGYLDTVYGGIIVKNYSEFRCWKI